MVASEEATETIWQVAMQQSKYWKCMHPKAVEPREGLRYALMILLPAQRHCRITSTYTINTR
jgi:hypothetical protein